MDQEREKARDMLILQRIDLVEVASVVDRR